MVRGAKAGQPMTYTSLMVHLDLDQSNDARLQIASDIAQRFEAAVIGIAASEQSAPLYYVEGSWAKEFIDRDQAELARRLGDAESQFRKALQGRSKSIEWRSAVAIPGPYVARNARAADLLIAGSRRAGSLDVARQLDPSELILQAGRPVMLVPPATKWLKFDSALVAWKDTRESRNAAAAALPLLRQFKDVTVAEVVEDSGRPQEARAHVDDVVAWLRRHGVVASGVVPDRTGDAVSHLERIASDVGADVIVAGTYGRSRANEWIFGGVSRDLLMQSKRCCFLMH
jgi:nucleotide-binding universal stress UspA family protein